PTLVPVGNTQRRLRTHSTGQGTSQERGHSTTRAAPLTHPDRVPGRLRPRLVDHRRDPDRVHLRDPGCGSYFLETINSNDINGAVGVAFLTAVTTCAGLLLADIVVAMIDPRVRLS